MSHHNQAQNANVLNPNLVAIIFILNLVVIGGLLFSHMSTAVPETEGSVEVVLVELTATILPSATPVPLTLTPTVMPTNTSTASAIPTEPLVPTATVTPQAIADAGQTNTGNTASGYDPALVSQGEQLFLVCSACHGPDARGLPNLGKNLVESEFIAGLTDEGLLEFLKTGRPIWDSLNTTGIDMPPKGGNPAFNDGDMLAIIAYIRSLSATGG